MKIFTLIFLLFYFSNLNSFKIENSSGIVIEAFRDAIQRFYIEKERPFEIILYGKSSRHLDEVICGIGNSFVTSIRRINNENLWNHKINISAVVLMKDATSSTNLRDQASLGNLFPVNFFFLFYFGQEIGDSDFENQRVKRQMLYEGHNDPLAFAYYLFKIKDKDEMELLTLELFTHINCDVPQPKYVDTYRNFSWENNLAISERFRNFNKCLISFLIRTDHIEAYEDFEGKIQGSFVEIDRILAQKGNFTPEISFCDPDATANTCHENFHVIQSIKMHSDMIKPGYQVTVAFWQRIYIFLITPGERYSQWEKIVLPFDLQTWIYSLTVFAAAFVTTFFVNRMSENVRNLFLGSSSQYPAYNILGTFFGISQTRAPDGNFARMILMIFILFCLIIRTAYQGEILHF
jgi:hypothetical protein